MSDVNTVKAPWFRRALLALVDAVLHPFLRLKRITPEADLAPFDASKPVCYQIVGDDEADIKAGKVSINSPVARALIGKYAGDIAEVNTPGGIREYEVIDVKYV